MNKFSILTIMCLGLVTASMTTSDVSDAAAAACTGRPLTNADNACFAVGFGCAVNNICAGVRRWDVSDNVAAGNHQVFAAGMRPNGGSFVCKACSTIATGFDSQCTASVPLNVVDIDTRFLVGTVNVPANGSLYVTCNLSQGAWYDSTSL